MTVRLIIQIIYGIVNSSKLEKNLFKAKPKQN